MPMEQLTARMGQHAARRLGRPFITLAYAQSLDGSIAAERGQPLALSGPGALVFTHRLRAMHDAILAGIGTVLTDDPRLDVRLVAGENPRPIVVDTRLRIPVSAALLRDGREPWIATTDASPPERRRRITAAGADLLAMPALPNGWVDLEALVGELFARGVRTLMVEGGARIISSCLRARLADHLVVTVSPRLVGGLMAVSRAHPLGDFEPPSLGAWQTSHLGPDLLIGAPLVWNGR